MRSGSASDPGDAQSPETTSARPVELVYENYNCFVIGYGPNERASEAVLSLTAQAKGVAICFTQGAKLPDPKGVLIGGNQTRSLRLENAEALSRVEVEALIQAAQALEKTPMPAAPNLTQP